jgi:hypothetical protein
VSIDAYILIYFLTLSLENGIAYIIIQSLTNYC